MEIFVYGTLQSEKLLAAVAGGDPLTAQVAHLDGYIVRPVADNVVPLISVMAGSVVTGQVISGITASQLARLDAYESAFGYELIDVVVQVAGVAKAVKMYWPPDGIAAGAGDWSLADWTAEHEAVAVLGAQEMFSYDPPLTPAGIRRRWPMIENRAWARLRATSEVGPATLRRFATAQDFTVTSWDPIRGNFFALQSLKLHHTQFNGQRSEVIAREVFVGIDAAIVLPYDPKRDRILLVEQIRLGPIVRGDPQPWMLEPIAGMVDARETPLEAAIRESAEEAGLTDLDLRHISSFYPSPGSATDFFHAYAGICDLPDDHARFGGLEVEAEDLRLHLVSFDAAMDMVASGEINAGPLVMMLYWLASQRDALRGLR